MSSSSRKDPFEQAAQAAVRETYPDLMLDDSEIKLIITKSNDFFNEILKAAAGIAMFRAQSVKDYTERMTISVTATDISEALSRMSLSTELKQKLYQEVVDNSQIQCSPLITSP